MDINFGTALGFTGVALLILMVVLTALAGLIYFLTGVIKDNEQDEEGEVQTPAAVKTTSEVDVDRANKMKAALVAVALARSTRAGRKVALAAGSETSAWKQFHQARRLNQTLRVRRPS